MDKAACQHYTDSWKAYKDSLGDQGGGGTPEASGNGGTDGGGGGGDPQWWNPFTWSGDTWQDIGASVAGIAVGIAITAAVVGAIGCAAVTLGVCGAIIIGVGIAAGAVGAAVTYGLQSGEKSAEGLGQSMILGGIGGAIPGVGAVLGKVLAGAGKPMAATIVQAVTGAGGTAKPATSATSLAKPPAARPTQAASCGLRSFSASTLVLMADGSRKPIGQIEIGDLVIATDPETGEQKTSPVTYVWVHEDSLLDLVIDGETITTTEDHPFWSVTDRTFEDAEQLTPGELVLNSQWQPLEVEGFVGGSERRALAYNLTVDGIHTYHVGEQSILVHNSCPPAPSPYGPDNRFTDDAQAAIDLANEYKTSGITRENGATLADWGSEYGLNSHGPAVHAPRSGQPPTGFGQTTEHINVGPVRHIRVID